MNESINSRKKGVNMKNVKKPAYIPVELEIILLESSDILTTSGYGNELEDDPNLDPEW